LLQEEAKAKVASDRKDHNIDAMKKRKRKEEAVRQRKEQKVAAAEQLTRETVMAEEKETQRVARVKQHKANALENKRKTNEKAEQAPVRSAMKCLLRGITERYKSKLGLPEGPFTLGELWDEMNCSGEYPPSTTLGCAVSKVFRDEHSAEFTFNGLLDRLCGWELIKCTRPRVRKSDTAHKVVKISRPHTYSLQKKRHSGPARKSKRDSEPSPGKQPYLPKGKLFPESVISPGESQREPEFPNNHFLSSVELEQPVMALAMAKRLRMRAFIFSVRNPHEVRHDSFCPSSLLTTFPRSIKKSFDLLDSDHTTQQCKFLVMLINTGKKHWAAILHEKGSPHLEVFDGYGREIQELGDVKTWVDRLENAMGLHKPATKNKRNYQKTNDTQCGMYALWFIWQRCTGVAATDITKFKGFSANQMCTARCNLMTTSSDVLASYNQTK
jgi:hypothetical protein